MSYQKYRAKPVWVYNYKMYSSKKIAPKGSRRFASQKEGMRGIELMALEQQKEITDLKFQPRFEITYNGERLGDGRGHWYVADFQYVVGDEQIVEDVKGMKLPLYKLKRDLFKKIYPQYTFLET